MTVLSILATAVFLWFALRRTNELCVLDVRDGIVRLARGRAPSRFLSDVAEIARHAGVTHARVRVVAESGAPRLHATGALDAATVQKLRNVTGEHQVLHFRNGRRAGR